MRRKKKKPNPMLLKMNPSNRTELAKTMFRKGRREYAQYVNFVKENKKEFLYASKYVEDYDENVKNYYKAFKTLTNQDTSRFNLTRLKNNINQSLHKLLGDSFKEVKRISVDKINDILTVAYYLETKMEILRDEMKRLKSEELKAYTVNFLLNHLSEDEINMINGGFDYHKSQHGSVEKTIKFIEENGGYNLVYLDPKKKELLLWERLGEFFRFRRDELIKGATVIIIPSINTRKRFLNTDLMNYEKTKRELRKIQGSIQTRHDFNLYMIRFIRLVSMFKNYLELYSEINGISERFDSYSAQYAHLLVKVRPEVIFKDFPYLYDELTLFGYISNGNYTNESELSTITGTSPIGALIQMVKNLTMISDKQSANVGSSNNGQPNHVLGSYWYSIHHILDLAVQLDNTAIINMNFSYTPHNVLFERLQYLENLYASQKKLKGRATDKNQVEFGETLISYPNQKVEFYEPEKMLDENPKEPIGSVQGEVTWEYIPVKASNKEAKFGSHCGNTFAPKENDSLLSLRINGDALKKGNGKGYFHLGTAVLNTISLTSKKPQRIFGKEDVVSRFVYQTERWAYEGNEFIERIRERQRGQWPNYRGNPKKLKKSKQWKTMFTPKEQVVVMAESKGYNDSKFPKEAHKYMVDLLIKKKEIDFIIGGRHANYLNFYLSDLSSELTKKLKSKRPDLYDLNYLRRKIGTGRFFLFLQNIIDLSKLGHYMIDESGTRVEKKPLPITKEKFSIFTGYINNLVEWVYDFTDYSQNQIPDIDDDDFAFGSDTSWLTLKNGEGREDAIELFERWLKFYNVKLQDDISPDDVVDMAVEGKDISDLFKSYGVGKIKMVNGATRNIEPERITSSSQLVDSLDQMLAELYENSVRVEYYRAVEESVKTLLDDNNLKWKYNSKNGLIHVYFTWTEITNRVTDFLLNKQKEGKMISEINFNTLNILFPDFEENISLIEKQEAQNLAYENASVGDIELYGANDAVWRFDDVLGDNK